MSFTKTQRKIALAIFATLAIVVGANSIYSLTNSFSSAQASFPFFLAIITIAAGIYGIYYSFNRN